MWLYLHNSVRTGAMNRTLRLRNVRCGLFTYTNVYPRAPTVMSDCIYIIHADGRDKSAPTPTDCTLRIVHVYPRAPTVMRDCIYIIRVNGCDKSAPTPTECMLRIVHVHQRLHHVHPL